jgi:ketosteroid isomerase-like protein
LNSYKAKKNLNINYHDILYKWFSEFGNFCKSRDFKSAGKLVSNSVCSFGTKVDLVTNLNDLEEEQWKNIWPNIENFTFIMEKLICDGDSELAWGIIPWRSVGFDENGNSFDRPGRATVILKKFENDWLAIHTHFSLIPGTPHTTYGKKS